MKKLTEKRSATMNLTNPLRPSSLPITVAAVVSMLIAAAVARADDDATGASANRVVLEEITVTATRREEELNKVPINITAYSPQVMDDQGIRQIDDIARLTPDLQFTHTTGAAGNNSSNISIRGVFSDSGAATTGIYVDDTPIQMRNIGYWNATAFPQIFDLERVEVLRGPQGTLFGAGAEGGAVRFITPEPGLDHYSGYARSDLAETVGGAPSYEAGGAIGGPIVQDVLGFRASVWGREDSGYVNRLSPDTGAMVDAKANHQQSMTGRLALGLQPMDGLKLTASILYQNVFNHDRDQYWSNLSDPSSDQFNQASRRQQPTRDSFYLPALKVQYDLDNMSFISNSSYFYHRDYADLDYTTYFNSIFNGDALLFAPGDSPSYALIYNRQNTFTEEARLQSTGKGQLIDWTVGFFYSDSTQNDADVTIDGAAGYVSEHGSVPSFTQYAGARDKQVAGYADVDLNATDALKISVGARISNDKFTFTQYATSAGAGSTSGGSQSATPVTPKFGVSYQLDANNFVYASAAKGFRQGGVNGDVPVDLCGTDLTSLGLNQTPGNYKPDSLWSYELGAKDSLFGGRLGLDSSVYLLKWKSIQQSVRLPDCGFSFVGNLGEATGIGGDVSARFKVTSDFLAGINAGYVSLTYNDAINEGPNAVLVEKGDTIGGPPFHASAWTLYNFNVFNRRAFYRVDFSYQNGNPAVDSRTYSYDSTLPAVGPLKSLSMRLGTNVGGWELSVYGNNITNNESPTAISHDIPGSPIYYYSSYRPATYGLTAAYRF
jgi:iron complex outermembrane receptor protein